MEASTKLRILETKVNILGLHENVFREIFRHLEVETVYFTLRLVCQKMKNYVDEYLQLGGIFMLGAGRKNSTEILYVFTKRNKETSIYSKLAASYPYPVSCHTSPAGNVKGQFFGAMMNGKIVIGFNFWGKRANKLLYVINKYNPKQNKWAVVESRDAYTDQFIPNVEAWCPIGDSKLLLLHCNNYSEFYHT